MSETPSKSANVRRGARPLLVLGVIALAAALVTTLILRDSRQGGPDLACPLNRLLVPACGALLGVEPASSTPGALDQVDDETGHRFDLVYSFHDINDTIPSAFDRQIVADGRVLHIDIDSRDYSSADPSTVPWAGVAAGEFDQDLAGQARGIAALKVPVFVTFDHEPDQPARSAVGTPSDFVAAWRHVHDLFEANGASNAVWVWVVMALPQTYAATPAFWPGSQYVDWISWDSYDEAGCRGPSGPDPAQYQSFRTATLGYLDWLRAQGPATGIDLHLPMMISETGTVALPGNPSPTATWYDELPEVLRAEPDIKAVTLWDHTGSDPACDFRFGSDPDVLASVRRAAVDPWMDAPDAPLP